MHPTRMTSKRPSGTWIRALTVLMMLAGLITATTRGSAAQSEGVAGSTFTGVNFDWSVEWDADAWDAVDEDNSSDADYFVLESNEVDFGMLGFTVRGDFAKIDECTESWVDSVGHGGGATDFERIDDPVDIPVRSDATTQPSPTTRSLKAAPRHWSGTCNASPYRLTQERDGETITRIAYVECRTLVEDEAVMVISLYAREATFEDAWDAATAVIDSIEISLEGRASDSSIVSPGRASSGQPRVETRGLRLHGRPLSCARSSSYTHATISSSTGRRGRRTGSFAAYPIGRIAWGVIVSGSSRASRTMSGQKSGAHIQPLSSPAA